jgi:hypothetical protein
VGTVSRNSPKVKGSFGGGNRLQRLVRGDAYCYLSSAAFPIWMELSVLVAGQSAHVSYLSGFALNNEGREQAAMGIAVGDYNRDAKVDFCITNFSDDYNTLNRNDPDASFTDVSYAARIANATTPFSRLGHRLSRL